MQDRTGAMKTQLHKRHMLLVVVGGVAGGVVLLAIVLIAEFLWTPPWLVASSTVGWMVPVASVAVIAAASWALLAQATREDEDDPSLYVACDSCGHAVFREWRLCPYCGSRLEPIRRPRETMAR